MICQSREELDFCSHAIIITVYYKIIDNIRDGGIKSKLLAFLLYPIVFLMHKKAKRLAPDIDKIIGESMAKQSETEKKQDVCIDEAAHPSADALGKIFSLGFEGENQNSLYTLGYMIGRYVYILDAADDIEDDLKNGSFNPFRAEYPQGKEDFANKVTAMLNLTQSNALETLDAVEKKRFEDILENIVFDGIEASVSKVLEKYEVTQ